MDFGEVIFGVGLLYILGGSVMSVDVYKQAKEMKEAKSDVLEETLIQTTYSSGYNKFQAALAKEKEIFEDGYGFGSKARLFGKGALATFLIVSGSTMFYLPIIYDDE